MALRINACVVKGEIDNRLRDHVMAKLWLLGGDEPIRLNLRGNCLKDIAGSRICFVNPTPQTQKNGRTLTLDQEGIVGDITASRKVKVLSMPIEEAYQRRKDGFEVPLHTANCVYIEWFSTTNGRVVLESTDYQITSITEPSWTMTAEDEAEQEEANREVIRRYIEDMSVEQDNMRERSADDITDMDEFEWEEGLRQSDQLTDKYSDLLDLYMDHPDRERIIAREMEWTWLDDALDADERGAFDDDDDDFEDAIPELEPNPMTEGLDWIRTSEGHIKHPLSHRAFKVSMNMWHYCHDLQLTGENADDDLHEMLFESQILGAKLAGALDSLAYDHTPQGGFVVACLKRALQYFDKTIAAADKVQRKQLIEASELRRFRRDLFDIREEMLNLMKHYRT